MKAYLGVVWGIGYLQCLVRMLGRGGLALHWLHRICIYSPTLSIPTSPSAIMNIKTSLDLSNNIQYNPRNLYILQKPRFQSQLPPEQSTNTNELRKQKQLAGHTSIIRTHK